MEERTWMHRVGRVVYECHGRPLKGTILWIHGFCEDRRMWWPFIAPYEAEGYALVTMDVGGFGAGTLTEQCSIADMADQVEAVRLAIGAPSCYLVGHSMGGYVATAYAHRYAGAHLRGLTLLHSHPYCDDEEKRLHRDRAIGLLERVGVAKFVAGLIPQLFPPDGREAMREVIDLLVSRASEYPTAVIQNALEAMRDRPDVSAALAAVDCPVQCIVGQRDGAVPEALGLRQLSLARVTDAHLLPTVAHMGMYEATTEVQGLLRAFWAFGEGPWREG